MKRVSVFLLLIVSLLVFPTATYADRGDGHTVPFYQEDSGADKMECGTQTWDANVDAGKTAVNNWSTATDGCHTYRWNGSIGAQGGRGTVTFKVKRTAEAWELGVSPADGNYCAYSKVQEANFAMAYRFGVPDDTEVRVDYDCR